jgi:NAD(P)-dependent dehydrogenase (short-subunit alcohol dehydrogenase family)
MMTWPLDMSGRTVMVTGASAGIGRDASLLLGELGARLILVGRNHDRLNATATMLPGSGHCVEPFDLNRLEAIPGWMKQLATRHGEVGGVVHCAGLQQTLPLRAMTVQSAEELMRVNVLAALMLAKGLRQKGVRAEDASLVLVASVMGLVGAPGRAAYCASKGAVISMTRAMAIELAVEKIRVNCVAPAFVRTEMLEELRALAGADQIAAVEARHPLGFGEPRDVSHSIAFLLSPASRWMTGSILTVDGGYTAQ